MRDYFLGQWKLSRKVTGSHQACLNGTARFTLDAEHRLLYREQGFLIVPEKEPLWCERAYWYEFGEDGKIRVLFQDGRQFLSLRFSRYLLANGSHVCGLDKYEAFYHFVLEGQLRIVFSVQGPSKQYSISNCLTRMSREQ